MPTSTTQHIPEELIEEALALTGTEIEEMEEIYSNFQWELDTIFSIKAFCYYLFSDSFLKAYILSLKEITNEVFSELEIAQCIGAAIYEYQKWKPFLLKELLEKI